MILHQQNYSFSLFIFFAKAWNLTSVKRVIDWHGIHTKNISTKLLEMGNELLDFFDYFEWGLGPRTTEENLLSSRRYSYR